MTINEIQDKIIEEFSIFSDWMDKYSYLIELGNEIQLIDEKYKTDEYIIKGCQSNVWLHAEYKDGIITFTADSNAILTKGMTALVTKVLSGHTPDEILNADLYFVKEIGLDQHLSPTRANGLTSLIKQIKLYAMAYKVKNS